MKYVFHSRLSVDPNGDCTPPNCAVSFGCNANWGGGQECAAVDITNLAVRELHIAFSL